MKLKFCVYILVCFWSCLSFADVIRSTVNGSTQMVECHFNGDYRTINKVLVPYLIENNELQFNVDRPIKVNNSTLGFDHYIELADELKAESLLERSEIKYGLDSAVITLEDFGAKAWFSLDYERVSMRNDFDVTLRNEYTYLFRSYEMLYDCLSNSSKFTGDNKNEALGVILRGYHQSRDKILKLVKEIMMESNPSPFRYEPDIDEIKSVF